MEAFAADLANQFRSETRPKPMRKAPNPIAIPISPMSMKQRIDATAVLRHHDLRCRKRCSGWAKPIAPTRPDTATSAEAMPSMSCRTITAHLLHAWTKVDFLLRFDADFATKAKSVLGGATIAKMRGINPGASNKG